MRSIDHDGGQRGPMESRDECQEASAQNCQKRPLYWRKVWRACVASMLRWTRRYGIGLLAGVGGLFVFIVYTPAANLLARPLDRIQSAPTKSDVIVILSGGRYLDGSLNEAAIERTITAVRLFHQGLAPLLLFSGGGCCGHSTSALMGRLAMDLGTPRSAILLEEQSRRTYESAVNVTATLRSNGMRSAILVTSRLHMLRAKLAFEAAGISARPVHASEKNLWLVSSAEERIALLQATVHEYLGLVFYRLRGWI